MGRLNDLNSAAANHTGFSVLRQETSELNISDDLPRSQRQRIMDRPRRLGSACVLDFHVLRSRKTTCATNSAEVTAASRFPVASLSAAEGLATRRVHNPNTRSSLDRTL